MPKDWWSKHSSWILAGVCALLQLLWFYVQLREWKEEGHDHMLTVANFVVICGLWSLIVFTAIYFKKARKPSRLKIHNADYRAMDRQGTPYDVTECLQKMVRGDSLVLDIANHNFQVDGQNYVPKDPFFGVMKRLDVSYSFSGVNARAIRPEQSRMVLPEDTFIASAVAGVPMIPFSKLQLEAFQLAKDIREFVAAFPPRPPLTDRAASIKASTDWDEQLMSTYKLRFGKKIEEIFLRFGASGHPIDPSLYRAGAHQSDDEIRWEADVITAMAHRIEGVKLYLKTQ